MSPFCIILILLCEIIKCYTCGNEEVNLSISVRTQGELFNHFWKSTGFCPPDPKDQIPSFFESKDVLLNLALIGSLPNRGFEQVRIHWMFNLIKSFENDNKISFNYTHLDQILNHLSRYRLRPGFELMGYTLDDDPDRANGKLFKNFTRENWKSFTNSLVAHLIRYLQYVFGNSDGLQEAFRSESNISRPALMGPAGLFKDRDHHPLCWGVLEYCNEFINSCPIQHVSFHRKGDGTAEGVLNGTVELLDSLYSKLPNVKNLPVVNDEADIIVNWSRSLEWRADTRYAAMIAKVIIYYYKLLHLGRKVNIQLISNDNGFLNYHPFYFTQRTLFARFQMNNTNPPHSQFIKKPSYAVMGLLSLLGDEYLEANISISEPRLTVLATKTRNSSVAMMLVYCNGSSVETDNAMKINVTISNLEGYDTKSVVYLLDNVHTNPYKIWTDAGSPVFPEKSLRRHMRDVEEPLRIKGPDPVISGFVSASLSLTVPSIVLVHVCSRPHYLPGKVQDVIIYNITWNEVLLTWNDTNIGTKCIRTYEVELESRCENSLEFKRVNANDTVFLSYHHDPTAEATSCETTTGRYRVRTVDYWGRPGEYSDTVSYPKEE